MFLREKKFVSLNFAEKCDISNDFTFNLPLNLPNFNDAKPMKNESSIHFNNFLDNTYIRYDDTEKEGIKFNIVDECIEQSPVKNDVRLIIFNSISVKEVYYKPVEFRIVNNYDKINGEILDLELIFLLKSVETGVKNISTPPTLRFSLFFKLNENNNSKAISNLFFENILNSISDNTAKIDLFTYSPITYYLNSKTNLLLSKFEFVNLKLDKDCDSENINKKLLWLASYDILPISKIKLQKIKNILTQIQTPSIKRTINSSNIANIKYYKNHEKFISNLKYERLRPGYMKDFDDVILRTTQYHINSLIDQVVGYREYFGKNYNLTKIECPKINTINYNNTNNSTHHANTAISVSNSKIKHTENNNSSHHNNTDHHHNVVSNHSHSHNEIKNNTHQLPLGGDYTHKNETNTLINKKHTNHSEVANLTLPINHVDHDIHDEKRENITKHSNQSINNHTESNHLNKNISKLEKEHHLEIHSHVNNTYINPHHHNPITNLTHPNQNNHANHSNHTSNSHIHDTNGSMNLNHASHNETMNHHSTTTHGSYSNHSHNTHMAKDIIYESHPNHTINNNYTVDKHHYGHHHNKSVNIEGGKKHETFHINQSHLNHSQINPNQINDIIHVNHTNKINHTNNPNQTYHHHHYHHQNITNIYKENNQQKNPTIKNNNVDTFNTIHEHKDNSMEKHLKKQNKDESHPSENSKLSPIKINSVDILSTNEGSNSKQHPVKASSTDIKSNKEIDNKINKDIDIKKKNINKVPLENKKQIEEPSTKAAEVEKESKVKFTAPKTNSTSNKIPKVVRKQKVTYTNTEGLNIDETLIIGDQEDEMDERELY